MPPQNTGDSGHTRHATEFALLLFQRLGSTNLALQELAANAIGASTAVHVSLPGRMRVEVTSSCMKQGLPCKLCTAIGSTAPVKPLIIPALAFLYKPLGSRCSQTSMGTCEHERNGKNLRLLSIAHTMTACLQFLHAHELQAKGLRSQPAVKVRTCLGVCACLPVYVRLCVFVSMRVCVRVRACLFAHAIASLHGTC